MSLFNKGSSRPSGKGVLFLLDFRPPGGVLWLQSAFLMALAVDCVLPTEVLLIILRTPATTMGLPLAHWL
jgi:hypothetical protein